MSRVVDEQRLRDWFTECHGCWPEDEYQFLLKYERDERFKRALETAYLLGQVSGIPLRITAIFFVL